MSKISTYFDIKKTQEELDFLDVFLDKDNLLFLDPRKIRIHGNPAMSSTLQIYSSHLFDFVRKQESSSLRQHFKGLSEPNETRLGFSKNNRGNAMGKKLTQNLLLKLLEIDVSIFRNTGINNLGDFHLIIDKVGPDRISDMVTKVIKKDLIDFTINQCNLHRIETKSVNQKDLYCSEQNKWERSDVELPHYTNADNIEKPIIFVPKRIVQSKNQSNNNLNFFISFACENYLKNDKELNILIKGKYDNSSPLLIKEVKDYIKDNQLKKKQEHQKWLLEYEDLIINYQDSLNATGRLEVLEDEEITRILNKE